MPRSLSMLTIGLDATVLNVALPTLATSLDASTSQLQWFGATYTLVIGALVIPMGGLGDRFGRKRLLLAAWWSSAPPQWPAHSPGPPAY